MFSFYLLNSRKTAMQLNIAFKIWLNFEKMSFRLVLISFILQDGISRKTSNFTLFFRKLNPLWRRRLYYNSLCDYKLNPLYLAKVSRGSSFKFYSNLPFKRNEIRFVHISLGGLFYTGKSILLWRLKYFLRFCINTWV